MGTNARVCHVCSAHSADDGRIFERDCVSLAEAGYEVHLIARSQKSESYSMRGVTVHPVPVYGGRSERIRKRKKVAEIAESLDPSLYHVHEPELLGSTLAVSHGRPLIWDVHEPFLAYISVKQWIPRPARPLISLWWDRYERSLVKKCAAIVTAAESLTPRYRSIHSNVTTIHNYPRIAATAEGLKPESPHALVFTGTISPNRGIAQVIRAMGVLKKRGVSVILHLAGAAHTSTYIDELMSLAVASGVRDRIEYYGSISRSEAVALQKRCAVGLNISNSSMYPVQGYSVKMFEFMLAGLPVIYSNIPSFVEIAGQNDAGVVVNPDDVTEIADAIERLIIDPIFARRLGENGRRAILEKYNWEAEERKLKEIYRSLL